MVIGPTGCGGGPVGHSDWLRVEYAARLLPGPGESGSAIYKESASTAAAPVTGSLVFSTPLDCLDVYCAAEFASCLLFGGMDCVWLAGFGLFFRQVSLNWIMATDGAALVEGRAGITFGVELYVPVTLRKLWWTSIQQVW